MATRQIAVERFSSTSQKPFDEVVAGIDAQVGHPDMSRGAVAAAISEGGLGSSGLMEFARYDLGAVLRMESAAAPRIVRLVIGNPMVMKEMVKHVPDAGSYAPVTILIDERADGVHVSYDRMASYLAPYGNADALNVARALDGKVEDLIAKAL